MKLFCALLVLLLVAGPVAAVSMNPASVQPAVKVTTAKPLVTMTIQRTLVQPAGTEPVSPMLSISSVPSGAAVTADGTARGVTPVTIGLYPGTHTIVLTLDGYKDYSGTVTLADGEKKAFEAQLVRALSAGTFRQDVSTIGTRATPLRINRTIMQGVPVTKGTPPVICTSGQMCLTLEDAAAIYAPGWGYKVTDICGYVASADNGVINKYCTFGTSNVGNPPASCTSDEKCLALEDAAAGYAAGWWYTEGSVCDYVTFTDNQTIIPKYCTGGSPKQSLQQSGVNAVVQGPAGLVPVSPQPVLPGATRQVLGAKRQVGAIDSFFGFFSGIFTSRPICLTGQAACGGRCIDVMNDSLNCGSCDYTCFDPAVCEGGECVDGYHFPPNPADILA